MSLALHGDGAQTNFPAHNYRAEDVAVYRCGFWHHNSWALLLGYAGLLPICT